MSDPSLKSEPMICAATDNAISSPASEDGLTRSDSPVGPTTDLLGQALAPVNRSASPAKEAGLTMSATYGRHGSGSFASLALTQSLASRYRARTHSLGSTMFDLTWKARVTPSGFSIPAQRASGRRISGNDFTSWRSPTKGNGDRGGQEPTQRAGHMLNLQDEVLLAAWPTPDCPRAHDSENTAGAVYENKKQLDLAKVASWATPTTRDHKDGACDLANVPVNALLGRQARLTDSGATPSGSHAETGKRWQLNPALSRWLMGYPQEWCDCAVTAMQSYPSKRGRSSKPTPK
jgi:hypothetical protein